MRNEAVIPWKHLHRWRRLFRLTEVLENFQTRFECSKYGHLIRFRLHGGWVNGLSAWEKQIYTVAMLWVIHFDVTFKISIAFQQASSSCRDQSANSFQNAAYNMLQFGSLLGLLLSPENGGCIKKTKLHGLSPQANYTDRLSNRRLSAKLVPTLADRECRVVSATIFLRNLGLFCIYNIFFHNKKIFLRNVRWLSTDCRTLYPRT
jgi:hypothetical protein